MEEIKSLKLKNWQFVLMMIVTIIVWAFAFPFIKIGLEELSFINLTIMRFFIVDVVLIGILLLQPKRFSKPHKKGSPINIFVRVLWSDSLSSWIKLW